MKIPFHPFFTSMNCLNLLQVNPYEVENVADTLNRALEMPLDERQLRMNQLKKREKRMDVDSWVQTFLQTMGAIYNDMVNNNKFKIIHPFYIMEKIELLPTLSESQYN